VETTSENGLANLRVEQFNVSSNMPELIKTFWNTQTNATLPWLVILYPASRDLEAPVWSGPLGAEDLRTLVDSPARRELAQRICKGQSAVWLMLESGDKAKDTATAELLRTETTNLQANLQLPPVEPGDPQAPEVPP